MKIKEAEVRCQLRVTSHQTTLLAEAAQKRETIRQGGKSQPQGHNCSQATVTYRPRHTQGYDHTEKCTPTGTQPHPHKNTVQCTRTVSHPKMQPTSPHRAGARPLGEATGRPGLVGSIQEPLAYANCRWGSMGWPGGAFRPYPLGSSHEVGQDLFGPQHWVHKEEATGALTY